MHSISVPEFVTPSGRLVDFMRQADNPALINLAAGIPGLDALPVDALDAAADAVRKSDGARRYAYQHPQGDCALRGWIAERLSGRGFSMTADDVLMTTGCQQALQLAVSLLAPPGSVVACEVPAYYALLELFGVAGVRVLPLYVRDEQGVDVAETVALLRMHRPKALFLCSSLSNPSGCTTAVDRRAQLAAACADLEIHLVEDDIYGELHEGGALPPASGMARHGGATYVSSFSKSLAPGLRVGFFASPRLAESAAVLKCQQDMHSAVGPEAVVRAFVQSGGFDTHLGWLRERNRERREFAAAVIADAFPAGCRLWKPNGGYMLWVDLPERTDMGTLAARCRDRGVVFAAGSVFFTTPQERPSVRLNCARATLDQLEMALRTLGSALRE